MSERTYKITQAKRAAFLRAYERLGTVLHAAEEAGIDRQTHYAWLKDPEYAAAFADAEEKSVDALEAEARRRGIYGTEEPVYHNGQIVGSIRKYSDTLLIFLLKGAKPQKYRDRVDISMDVRSALDRLTADPLEREAAVAEAERILAAKR